MKFLTSVALIAALALTPVTADAHGGGRGGGGFHGGGGGRFHGGGGGYRGGGGYGHGGYGGGWHGGGGGYGGGWYGFPGYWDGGFYGDPWLWGYPGDDLNDDYPVYSPPAAARQYPDAYAPYATPSTPSACGNWLWSDTDKQYHWAANNCQ